MKSLLPLLALCFCFAVSAAAQTQTEMNFQAKADYEKADTELNAAYQEAKKLLSPDRQKLLLTAQRAWLKYRDAAAKSAASAYEGGSIQPLITFTTLTEMTQFRTKQIKSLTRP